MVLVPLVSAPPHRSPHTGVISRLLCKACLIENGYYMDEHFPYLFQKVLGPDPMMTSQLRVFTMCLQSQIACFLAVEG